MKLLHLFSNHKLTGPAAPALRLAAGLRARGHDVTFAHAPLQGGAPGYIDSAAAELGLPTTTEFRLPKHFRWLAFWRDAHRLADYLDRNGIELVHCNLLNDHVTAARAVALSRRRPKLVRTNHDAAPMRATFRNRYVFSGRTDALIEIAHGPVEQDVQTFGFRPEQVHVIESSIDLARFDPARPLPDLRPRLGLSDKDFVVGIAARIQRRRRFDVLLEAAALARKEIPALKLAIIGRGTAMEAVAVRPARKLGLDDVVVFPGYLRGDDYVAGLRMLDVKVFLMPGTDGSCRAAREAMALGKPVIAARRGMLPEIVPDGEAGLVIDDTAENLAAAMIQLARDGELRRRMGDAARQTALLRFDPARQAEQVEKVYEACLSGQK